MDAYKHDLEQGKKCSPHVFELAYNAYSGLLRRNCPQSIIISGESGAVKIWM
jgi:myosin heavy subunit